MFVRFDWLPRATQGTVEEARQGTAGFLVLADVSRTLADEEQFGLFWRRLGGFRTGRGLFH
jgi:hypothetical protein